MKHALKCARASFALNDQLKSSSAVSSFLTHPNNPGVFFSNSCAEMLANGSTTGAERAMLATNWSGPLPMINTVISYQLYQLKQINVVVCSRPVRYELSPWSSSPMSYLQQNVLLRIDSLALGRIKFLMLGLSTTSNLQLRFHSSQLVIVLRWHCYISSQFS